MITRWNYYRCKGENIDRWRFESFGTTLQLLYPSEIRPQFETKVGQEALRDQIVHPKRSTRNAAIDGRKATKKMINEMDQVSDAFDQGSVLRIQRLKFEDSKIEIWDLIKGQLYY